MEAATEIKVQITYALRIPGRGTVLITEGSPAEVERITKGDYLILPDRQIPIYAVERNRLQFDETVIPTREAGLVVADGIKPADLAFPTDAIIRKEGANA